MDKRLEIKIISIAKLVEFNIELSKFIEISLELNQALKQKAKLIKDESQYLKCLKFEQKAELLTSKIDELIAFGNDANLKSPIPSKYYLCQHHKEDGSICGEMASNYDSKNKISFCDNHIKDIEFNNKNCNNKSLDKFISNNLLKNEQNIPPEVQDNLRRRIATLSKKILNDLQVEILKKRM